MAGRIEWNYVIQAFNDPSHSGINSLDVGVYDKTDVTVSEDGTPQQVDLAPADNISMLIINPNSLGSYLTSELSGNPVKLDGPHVLMGTGGRRPAQRTTLIFTNRAGAYSVLSILVGRDVTA